MENGGHLAQNTGTSLEIACIEKLLLYCLTDGPGIPLTAEELLRIGWMAFEPLFHEPPVGPIPEYLLPHLSVHGCVAEYENKVEELEIWKAHELSRWLQERVGRKWRLAAKVYELKVVERSALEPEKFEFRLIHDRIE